MNQKQNYTLSYHAQQRMAQRNLSPTDIAYIIKHGKRYHAGGANIVFLRSKDICQPNKRRLEGTTVVLQPKDDALRDGAETVVTVWRNRRKGMRLIKKRMA